MFNKSSFLILSLKTTFGYDFKKKINYICPKELKRAVQSRQPASNNVLKQ